MGVAADANGGGHHGRRTPWGEGNFSTAGSTAKSTATARGQHRQPKALCIASAIHPRKARLIDTLPSLRALAPGERLGYPSRAPNGGNTRHHHRPA